MPWSDLFLPDDFFTQYRYYLQVTAMSSSAETQLKWCAVVRANARCRVLTSLLTGLARSSRGSDNSS